MENYNDGNEKKYLSKNILKQFMIKRFLEKLLKITESCRGHDEKMSVLDVGCGEGFVANFLYDKIKGLKITAVDYFEEAVKKAQAGNQRNIRFEKGDIYRLNYDKDAFDMVLATEVLEHLDKPVEALEELVRTARKYVVVSVPNEPFFCLGNLLSGKNIKRLGNPIDHVNHWTYFGFEKFIRNNTKNVKLKKYNLFVWTLVVIEKDVA